MVADAEIGVRVLGQRDRLEERHLGEDGFLRPRGTGRVSAEGDPAAVGGRDHGSGVGSVREFRGEPGPVTDSELVARRGAVRALVRSVVGTSGRTRPLRRSQGVGVGEEREGRFGGRGVRGLGGDVDDRDEVRFVGQRSGRVGFASVPIRVAGLPRVFVPHVAPGGEELLAGSGVLGFVDVGEDHFVELAREAQEVFLVAVDLRQALADLAVAVKLVVRAAGDGGAHAHAAARDDLEADGRGDIQGRQRVIAEVPVIDVVAEAAARVEGVVEQDGFRPIADQRGAGEDAHLSRLEGDRGVVVLRQVETEAVLVVAFVGREELAGHFAELVADGGAALDAEEVRQRGVAFEGDVRRARVVLLEAELPVLEVGERDGDGVGLLERGARGRVEAVVRVLLPAGLVGSRDRVGRQHHLHVVRIMQHDDGRDIDADVDPFLVVEYHVLPDADGSQDEPLHLVDAEGEGDALDVRRGRGPERPDDQLVRLADDLVVGVGVDRRGEVAVVDVGVAVVSAAYLVGIRIPGTGEGGGLVLVDIRRARGVGVRPKGACPERGGAGGAGSGGAAGPAELFVEAMVIPQRPPRRAPDLAVGNGAAEDGRGGERGLRLVRIEHAQDVHRRGREAVLGHRARGRVGAGDALAELGRRELGVAELEGDGEVALQSAVERIGEDPGGGQADVVEVVPHLDRGAPADHLVQIGEELDVSQGAQGIQLGLVGKVLEQAVGQRAAQGDHLVDAAGVGLGALFAQVHARLDAFIADPVGVVPFDALIR